MSLRFPAAVGYLGLVAAWIYLGNQHRLTAIVLLGLTGAATLAVGALIGRWWALAIPLAAIPIAVPANFDPDFPTWFDVTLFFVPPAVFVMGAGVAARRLIERSRKGSKGQTSKVSDPFPRRLAG